MTLKRYIWCIIWILKHSQHSVYFQPSKSYASEIISCCKKLCIWDYFLLHSPPFPTSPSASTFCRPQGSLRLGPGTLWIFERRQSRKVSVQKQGDRIGCVRLGSRLWIKLKCVGRREGKGFTSIITATRRGRQMGSKFVVK